ncbi:MAG TPA: BTAD domain-containing putative transcriptional regulator [Acidimicrobiales bacterium]|nr:BTAD domain-containing putative transcriptional regulator [Acidimicrobiales bacterium]
MDYAILGGLAVTDGGRPVDLGGRKQRAVLAALLLDVGRPVSPERLHAFVWGDALPANPETSLQAFVSNLRRALEPGRKPREAARTLVTRPAGYALLAARTDVDATRFEDLVAAGHAALAAGDAAGAARILDDALAVWTGPPVPELAGEPAVVVATGRLEGRRAQALEDRFDAGLALSDHRVLVPRLEAAVAEQPFRERLRAQLALALYRCGRQREALAALAAARAALVEEVGVDPGPELQRLEADILAQAATLDDVAAPAARPDGPAMPAPARPVTGPAAGERTPGRGRGLAPSAGGMPFVGRVAELDGLVEAAALAAGGAGRPVVVSGEPGIGKTRLVEELIARLPGDAAVGWGGCPESAASASYWPCIQIGRQLEGADTLDRDLVAGLLPAQDVQRGGDDASADRLALHVALAEALASATRPVVVVVDDLQWADPASLRAIEFVAGTLRDMPVLLVCTARPVAEPSPPLVECLAELARQPGALRVDLGGLGGEDVARWLAMRGGGTADREVAELVHGRTGGNPFFVGEVVELLASEGHLRDPATARRRSAVPAAVHDAVRRRVSRLPAEAQQVLATASVVGRTFDADVLGAVAGLTPLDVLDRLDPALAAGLVAETDVPGRFQFAHALVGEALEAEIGPSRRARLHAATATALAELRAANLDAHLPELAHHALAGAAAGTAEAAYGWAVRAARQAAERVAHEDAAEHWGRAVRALELARPHDGQARHHALLEQARAWLQVDDIVAGYRSLVAAIDLAIGLDAPDLVARAAAAANIDAVWQTSEVVTGVDVAGALERALDAMPPGASAERSLALGALVDNAYWTMPVERLDALSAEAVALARVAGDPALVGRALHKRTLAIWRSATYGLRARSAAELLELVESTPVPPVVEVMGRLRAAIVAWEGADLAPAKAQMPRVAELAAQMGSPALIAQLGYFRAAVAAFGGRLREAMALAEGAYQLHWRTRRWGADALYGTCVMMMRADLCKVDEVRASAPAMLDTPYRPWLQEVLALGLAELGLLDEAAEVVDGTGLPPLVDCWWFLGITGAGCKVRAALGDADATRTLADAIRPYAGRLLTVGSGAALGDVHGALAHADRLLGDEEGARRHADASVAVLDAAGSGPDLARALLLRAELAPAGAAADRRRAAEIADRCDLPLVRSRLAAVRA